MSSLRPFWYLLFLLPFLHGQTKSPLTIDDLFSYTAIRSAKLAPGGNAVVLETTRADWAKNRFRDDLWLWRESQENLIPLAGSGHDSDPAWSPDGNYIAFISDRPLAPEPAPVGGEAANDGEVKEDAAKEIARVWIISAAGGEAFPLYREPLKVHTFAWSSDGKEILLSVPDPITKEAREAREHDWKDVNRWRQDERGDLLLGLSLGEAVPSPGPVPLPATKEEPAPLPKQARHISSSSYAIGEIAPSPDGKQVAFLTTSISGRLEHPEAYEIYLADCQSGNKTPARQLTHNQALERQLRWTKDGRQLYFGVFAGSGNFEGTYRDVQGQLYAQEIGTGQAQRLGKDFKGSWTDYALLPDGKLLALGQLATEVQMYEVGRDKSVQVRGAPGSYEGLERSEGTPAVLIRHSTSDQPEELFLAPDAAHLAEARQITHLNTLFAQRDLPRMKTYRWKAQDGRNVEGVLLYPPGRFDQKHLRMLTLIHGGPADADGNKFGADWYSWGMLAAAKGWLVFEPNYRGSTGYGDDFMLDISPHIVSVPGKDILSGVDALAKDGTADPDHLAIGGYSYGGYMTNWLVTQTTRFRSAVTGAGAVEHASNWGNDDLTFDDAWYLGGRPWEKPGVYQSEAALFQFDKVKTPIHDVIGSDDVRVSASQGYLLERALDSLGIPHAFLTFPGEGHTLGKNPWHGYIKVREELAWIEKYDRAASPF